jgi:hypothetical protein
MAIIRFKTRSLIRRFGSKPVEVSEALAKQYIDRRQAIELSVKERIVEVEEVVEEEVVEEEVVEKEETSDDKEEELELKIKKSNKE